MTYKFNFLGVFVHKNFIYDQIYDVTYI